MSSSEAKLSKIRDLLELAQGKIAEIKTALKGGRQ